MKRKTIAQLESDLAGARLQIEGWRGNAEKAQADMKAAETRHTDATIKLVQQIATKDKSIAALKAELFQAHQAIAAQRGYIARTLEDDNIRELGPVPEQQPNNQYPQGPQSRRGGIGFAHQSDTFHTYGQRETSTPWHDR